MKGTVKWFNITKGYGFIKDDASGKDVFIYKTAVEKAKLRTLEENQRVEFEIASDRGKQSAVNIRIISSDSNNTNNNDTNNNVNSDHRSE